jgi:L-lactate dehydrogenase (cytochrome)
MNDTATQANQAAIRAAIATGQRTDVAGKFPDILSLEDFEEPARAYLPRPIFGYISGAVETNASLAGNRSAFSEYDFLPRVLVNTRARNQKTTLFGRTYDLPFGFPADGRDFPRRLRR